MSTVPFKCPSCHSEVFATSSEPKSYDDLIGMTCDNCGHRLTDDDIKKVAVAIVEERLVKDFKFTRR